MSCTGLVGLRARKSDSVRSIPRETRYLQDSYQPGYTPLARANSLKESDHLSISQGKCAALEIASRVNGKPLYEFDSDSDFSGFRWIDPPRGHFWADPFVFEHDGRCWAFFEDYSYKEKRAAIICSEVSPQGELGPPVLCLDHPSHHYSYPHIFRAGSEIFMIPESLDSNSVDLFRCQQFPDQWVRKALCWKVSLSIRRSGSMRNYGGSRPQAPSQVRAPVVFCCSIRHRSPGIGIFIRVIRSPRTSGETVALAASSEVTTA